MNTTKQGDKIMRVVNNAIGSSIGDLQESIYYLGELNKSLTIAVKTQNLKLLLEVINDISQERDNLKRLGVFLKPLNQDQMPLFNIGDRI